ncbi:MAG: hypothetical protein ACJAZ0_001596 [Halioglobus sp.]|jgi:hypothetical protein
MLGADASPAINKRGGSATKSIACVGPSLDRLGEPSKKNASIVLTYADALIEPIIPNLRKINASGKKSKKIAALLASKCKEM